MTTDNYEAVLEWATSQGLKLHPHIERKTVNGVPGMYATADIPQYSVLAQFPCENLLQPDSRYDYPKQYNWQFRLVHCAARELEKGDEGWGGVRNFYDMAWLKQNFSAFYSDAEMDILKKMSVILYGYAIENKMETEGYVKAIAEWDKSLDTESGREAILRAMINSRMRAWGEGTGFVPILDMFNHSDTKGGMMVRSTDHKWQVLVSVVPVRKGEQVWISYGQKDINAHAIHYGYFDPEGSHSIDIGYRIALYADNPFQKRIYNYIKRKYPIHSSTDANNVIKYKLAPNTAFLLESAPNLYAIDFFRDVSFRTDEELRNRRYVPEHFRTRMLQYVDLMLSANKVDEVPLEEVPERLQYFHHMLQREKAILLRNKQWLIENCRPRRPSPEELILL